MTTTKRLTAREAVPAGGLLATALARVDAGDCFRTPVLPGDAVDAMDWALAMFGTAPGWVRALMRLRNALVAPLGLITGPRVGATPEGPRRRAPFPVISTATDEVLMGLDDRHLDFRVSVRMLDGDACVSTTVHVKNAFGRLYWGVVRHVHPRVVAAMVRRIPTPVRQAATPDPMPTA